MYPDSPPLSLEEVGLKYQSVSSDQSSSSYVFEFCSVRSQIV